jgi:hypothetical protein
LVQIDAGEEARISALSQAIAREEAGVAELRRGASELEAQAAALQASIDNAGGEGLKKARAAVAALQKAIGEGETELSKRGVQVRQQGQYDPGWVVDSLVGKGMTGSLVLPLVW